MPNTTGDIDNSDPASPAFTVAAGLDAVRGKIVAAAVACGRGAGDITLVAVGKVHGAERIEAALKSGQRVFGENRVQEAEAKFPALKAEYPDLKLHLIGPLQTNKAREAVALFDVIESLDRSKLARALAREMARLERRPECFVQVNTGREPQKAGILPEAADAFIAEVRDALDLPLVGLMCIPPQGEPPAAHFTCLAEIARRNGLAQLSMGMSADFEEAIRFGATHVRVGTAIFGKRPAPPPPP